MDDIEELKAALAIKTAQHKNQTKRVEELEATLLEAADEQIEMGKEMTARAERIEELETAINYFLGAYEHGRKEHVKEAVADLRRLINE